MSKFQCINSTSGSSPSLVLFTAFQLTMDCFFLPFYVLSFLEYQLSCVKQEGTELNCIYTWKWTCVFVRPSAHGIESIWSRRTFGFLDNMVFSSAPQTSNSSSTDCHCSVVRAEVQLLEAFLLIQVSPLSCSPRELLFMYFFFPQSLLCLGLMLWV